MPRGSRLEQGTSPFWFTYVLLNMKCEVWFTIKYVIAVLTWGCFGIIFTFVNMMKFAILSCIFIFTFVDMMKFDPTKWNVNFVSLSCIFIFTLSIWWNLIVLKWWMQLLQENCVTQSVFSTLHNANNTKTSDGTNQKVSLQSKGFSPLKGFLSIQKVSPHRFLPT